MPEQEKRVTLKMTMEIVDASGAKMFEDAPVWHDLPYSGALLIQEKMIGVMAELNQLGYQEAGQRAPEAIKTTMAHREMLEAWKAKRRSK